MIYEMHVETFDRRWLRDHGFGPERCMPTKESMTKLSEEVMECYSAWENMRDARANGTATSEAWLRLNHRLLDELADVIQAACNVAYLCGTSQSDMAIALYECGERNARRGRMGRR